MTIDLNCDMAEGIGNEPELMPWITSANIACGYHAGSDEEMKRTIDLCVVHNVAVGAHPSFPDRKNFGRTNMNLPPEQVYEIVVEQLQIIKKIAMSVGAELHHVKPHGALYNMAAKDKALANSLAKAVNDFDSRLILYGLSQSAMIEEARKLNLKTAHEVFADRTYQSDGSLTPRVQPNALITDESKALHQAILFVKKNKVSSTSGEEISMIADTLCLHGDGPHAVAFAKLIYQKLLKEQVKIQTIR
ncbi:MAG TPA: 5-oxoprolinase subunit PxpA [Cyclobacteriaceae bacterium]|nr:5-oxoprolinase subunit PxpA [Cyclobacteriaceae bacterium]